MVPAIYLPLSVRLAAGRSIKDDAHVFIYFYLFIQ